MSALPEGASYQKGRLHFASQGVAELAARFDTPLYAYSEEVLEKSLFRFPLARPGVTVCYAVKANSNLDILARLHGFGASFDIGSTEELRRVVTATQTTEVLKKCVATGPIKSVPFLKACLAYDVRINCISSFNAAGCPLNTKATTRTSDGPEVTSAPLEQFQVFSIHAESEGELARISSLRKSFPTSRTHIALRVNPDVADDSVQHNVLAGPSSCTNFGVATQEVLKLANKYPIQGFHCHIGSGVLNEQVLYRARDAILRILDQLDQAAEGSKIEYVDIGGALGVPQEDGQMPLDIPRVLDAIITPFINRGLKVFIEPGGSVVAQSGILLTRVEYTKSSSGRHFALVDAAVSDFVQPTLYGGYHRIVPECEPFPAPAALPVSQHATKPVSTLHVNGQTVTSPGQPCSPQDFRTGSIDRKKAEGHRPDARTESLSAELRGSRESLDGLLTEMQGSRLFKKQQAPPVPPTPSPRLCRRPSGEFATLPYDVVGPVCERQDVGLQRILPVLHEGDLLLVADVGAYGYAMASNYNSRCRPAQVMVLKTGEVKLISRREMLEDQLMLERNLQSFEMT
ncbi:diaminopimelate decarboxylase-like [Tropilaelaps mercedesae]|uniref:Diaminopimelate decarboxylase-like n=1 Tax=Tropilaelaps mercedesae TaxID=418985 RepID=A0A1V9X7H8_9ACAR|nr:diaminopimelate decarboxylase-like [Tropilaelaps mercedesae]